MNTRFQGEGKVAFPAGPFPLPHPSSSSLSSSFPFSSFISPSAAATTEKEERPASHQYSTSYKIQQNPLKMVLNGRAHTQPSALARILVSDKGRVLRCGITQVRRFKNPDSHQSCFISWLHHWLPWCWVQHSAGHIRSGLSSQSESAELYWNYRKKNTNQHDQCLVSSSESLFLSGITVNSFRNGWGMLSSE